jgi:hypothetical protein
MERTILRRFPALVSGERDAILKLPGRLSNGRLVGS